MYVDEETQRIRVQFTTTDDQNVVMELTVHQAAKLIEEATSAYYAIVPQLRNSRGFPF